MRSWMLCLCLAAASCGSGGKGAPEYDDVKNGLHMRAPGPNWTFVEKADCPPPRQVCWFMSNAKIDNGIYLVGTDFNGYVPPFDAKDPAGVTQEFWEWLQVDGWYSAKPTTVSAPVVSASGNVATISWNVDDSGLSYSQDLPTARGSDKRYVLRAGVVRLPSDPSRLFIFVALPAPRGASVTERDFAVFLESVSAAK